MEEGGEAPKTRGTRPFEAMVPWCAHAAASAFFSQPHGANAPVCFSRRSKPWTSQFLSVDDITARQSRCGYDLMRYRDGTLRPNRPRPPPGAVPPLQQSPREPFVFKNNVLSWESAGQPGMETTTKAGYSPRDALTNGLVVPTRHGLSPRYEVDSIGGIVFPDPVCYQVHARIATSRTLTMNPNRTIPTAWPHASPPGHTSLTTHTSACSATPGASRHEPDSLDV